MNFGVGYGNQWQQQQPQYQQQQPQPQYQQQQQQQQQQQHVWQGNSHGMVSTNGAQGAYNANVVQSQFYGRDMGNGPYVPVYQNTDCGQNFSCQKPIGQHTCSVSARRNSTANAQQLPPNWVARTDPRTGRIYYANTETKTTQWEFPVNPQQQQWQQATPQQYQQPQQMPQPQQLQQPQQMPQQPPQAQQLPPNWVACYDPQTDRTYYANMETKITQWDFPVDISFGPQPQQEPETEVKWYLGPIGQSQTNSDTMQMPQQQLQGPQQLSDQELQPTQDIQSLSNITAASDSSKPKTSEELREDLAQILKKIGVDLDTNDNNFITNALSEIVNIFNNPETWKNFNRSEKIQICELGSQFSKEVDNTKNIQFFEAKKIALNKYSNACEIFDKIHPKLLRANNNKQPCLAFLYTHNLSPKNLNSFIEGIRALKISSPDERNGLIATALIIHMVDYLSKNPDVGSKELNSYLMTDSLLYSKVKEEFKTIPVGGVDKFINPIFTTLKIPEDTTIKTKDRITNLFRYYLFPFPSAPVKQPQPTRFQPQPPFSQPQQQAMPQQYQQSQWQQPQQYQQYQQLQWQQPQQYQQQQPQWQMLQQQQQLQQPWTGGPFPMQKPSMLPQQQPLGGGASST